MENIILDQSDNLAGISKVEFVPFMYVSSIPEASEGIISESDIELKTDASFNEIEFQRNSAQEQIDQVDADGGNVFKYSLKIKFPKNSQPTTQLINELCSYPLVIKVTDNNGVKKIVGSIVNPAKCKYAISKAGNPSGFNGYELTFYWESTVNPYYLE